MPITFDGDMNLQITLDGEYGNLQYFSDYFQYAGNTTVTPSMSEQVLHTNGLIMPTDVTVKPIPDTYGEVTQSGTTVTVNTPNEYPGTTHVVLNSDNFYDNSDATLNNSNLMAQGVVGYGVNGQRYVGSILERSASDIVVSGNEITTPAGHYPTDVQTTIPEGQVGTPAAAKGAVSNLHTIAVTPNVSYVSGYINGGSKVGEPVIVSASELVSGSQTITENDTYDVTNLAEVVVDVTGHGVLQTKSATYTPTLIQQTYAIHPDEGYDGMDAVDITVNAMPSGTAGTPTASKGTVSNHSIAVTPSVTNTTGYITGGTKTGTAVTVSASELVSGTLSISSGGTWYVANTEYVTVPDGTEGRPTATKGTVTSHSVTVMPSVTNSAGYISGGTHNGGAVTVTAAELVSGTKSITQNGTGIDVTNYASVDVAVPVGADVPVFTTTDGWQTFTCNKTFAECEALVSRDPIYDRESVIGALVYAVNGLDEYWSGIQCDTSRSVSGVSLVYSAAMDGVCDNEIVYSSNGVIAKRQASSLTSLSVTQNGTYTPSYGSVYNEVTVNVPSSAPNLQAKTNIAPTTSSQTITADSGYDGLSSVQINAMPSGSATASATKGTVSNHSVTVTPSVTRTAGYVTAGTSSGTAVSVSASELVSGSQTLSDNGTYDVTNLAEVVVDVQGGGGGGGMTLLTTYTMGAIATSSTSSVSTGKTITFTGYNDYDVLVVDASVDTPTNNRHTSTVSMIYLTGPIGVETKTTYTMGSNKWNSQLSSIGVGITRQSTTAYGIYAQSPSVSNNTMSIEMYQRYNPSNTGTINGNYTVRVYGLKLYELIGG